MLQGWGAWVRCLPAQRCGGLGDWVPQEEGQLFPGKEGSPPLNCPPSQASLGGESTAHNLLLQIQTDREDSVPLPKHTSSLKQGSSQSSSRPIPASASQHTRAPRQSKGAGITPQSPGCLARGGTSKQGQWAGAPAVAPPSLLSTDASPFPPCPQADMPAPLLPFASFKE